MKLAFERATCKKVAVKIINKKNFPSVGVSDPWAPVPLHRDTLSPRSDPHTSAHRCVSV